MELGADEEGEEAEEWYENGKNFFSSMLFDFFFLS